MLESSYAPNKVDIKQKLLMNDDGKGTHFTRHKTLFSAVVLNLFRLRTGKISNQILWTGEPQKPTKNVGLKPSAKTINLLFVNGVFERSGKYLAFCLFPIYFQIPVIILLNFSLNTIMFLDFIYYYNLL